MIYDFDKSAGRVPSSFHLSIWHGVKAVNGRPCYYKAEPVYEPKFRAGGWSAVKANARCFTVGMLAGVGLVVVVIGGSILAVTATVVGRRAQFDSWLNGLVGRGNYESHG